MLRGLASHAASLAEPLVAPWGVGWDEPPKQRRSLERINHRPWSLPPGPWFMAQTWRSLLFAHWRVPAEAVRRVVPPQLELQVRDGAAWIGVTPFRLTGFRVRGTSPVPLVSSFDELNVRTYVSFGGKPGIYFLSLDAGSSFAVAAARRGYRLPYFHADMQVEEGHRGINYRSRRLSRDGPPARFEALYRPAGQADEDPGSLARWLAERYCLYTFDDRSRVLRADIHHAPWPLQEARADIGENTMTEALGIPLEGEPLVHYSARQDTVIWLPEPA